MREESDWGAWGRAGLRTLEIFMGITGVVLLLVVAQRYRWVAIMLFAVLLVAAVLLTFMVCLAAEVKKRDRKVK